MPAVRIYEVGPRDGLQNEAQTVPTDAKLRFIGLLADAGLREIESTSFVAPSAVPQLADADELMRSLERRDGVRYPVLVPNRRGMERALAAGADAIAVFTAASDAFTQRNIGMTIDESLAAFEPVIDVARAHAMWTRGYVSTAFGCPFTGRIEPSAVAEVSLRLLELGVDEISIGDTIGVAVPSDVRNVVETLVRAGLPVERLAMHFHDTRGTALANAVVALELGVRCFDSSTGGTGGCPYAPGAAGNLATEDLVYLLDGLGYEHGVELDRLLEAARYVASALGRPLASKVGQAGGWQDRGATAGNGATLAAVGASR